MTDRDIYTAEYVPAVRYGFPADADRARCSPRLYHVRDEVPDGAVTVSPVYLLMQEECDRHDDLLDNPYAVSGSNIAKQLQDQCESEDRVLYPIHAEADNYDPSKPEDCINQVVGFLEDRLGANGVSLYFSGRRSIHGHTNAFVVGESNREWIKREGEEFCEETGVELDLSIYNPKSMFRLPNVDHEKVPGVEIRKTEIEPHWPHERIFRETTGNTNQPPETYHDVLQGVTEEIKRPTLDVAGEQREPWYYGHPFSPYAHAHDGDGRSVAIFRAEGPAYCLRDSEYDAYSLLPAFLHGAVGCSGEFTVDERHAPLKLSKRDYDKLSYAQEGETYVLIGGKSGSSRVMELSNREAHDAAAILRSNGREGALAYLEAEGHDTGAQNAKSGNAKGTDSNGAANEVSKASELMQRAESDDFGSLTHNEKFRVACRLLHSGKEYAHEWIRRNFDHYDQATTEEQLTGILEQYPEDYR